jgi:large subunit ribosomal protein L15
MPLQRRIPKFGFRNIFKTEYQIVNLAKLEKLIKEGTVAEKTITPEVLRSAGAVRKGYPVKVLGNGSVTEPLNVSAHAFSKSAEEKIKAAGGTTTIVK